jgi:glutathione peroxidase
VSENLYDIPLKRLDGAPSSLSEFRGSVLLVVNVASKCGLTPQYEALEKLYRDRRDEGLVVLGFPANNFGAQEPGTSEEIQEFCTSNYGVDFPMFEKLSVKGEDQHPLYKELIDAVPQATPKPEGQLRGRLEKFGMGPTSPTDVLWNFEKFLIARDGSVAGRFAPDITPDDPIVLDAISAELARGKA